MITKDWTVSEITAHHPQVAEVFAEWGIHCFGCGVGGVETLGEAGRLHGFSEDDLERLVEDLNDAIVETTAPVLLAPRSPRGEVGSAVEARPQALHISKAAALEIRNIAKTERPGVYPERPPGRAARPNDRQVGPARTLFGTGGQVRTGSRGAGAAEVDGEVGLFIQTNEGGNFFMEFREKPEFGERVFWNEEVDDVKVYASPLTLRRIGGATIDYREGRFRLEVAPTRA